MNKILIILCFFSLKLYSQSYYSPEKYGAIANDEINDYVAIREMFTNMPDNSSAFLSSGKYIYTGILSIVIEKNITIVASNFSYIDATGFTGNKLFDIKGSIGSCDDIGSLSFKDTYIVNSAWADSLNDGDLFVLTTSPTYGGNGEEWKGGQGNYKGEITSVWYVSNDTIYLNKPLYEDYNSCRICKYNYIEVNLFGIDIRMNPLLSNQGIVLTDLFRSKLSNVRVNGTGTTGIQIYNAFESTFIGLKINDFLYNRVGNGNNYGINLYGGIDCKISDSYIKGGRHAIDVSGVNIPSRNVQVFNNTALAYADKAISTHPAAEYISFTNNDVYGGFTIRSLNTTVSDNDVYNFGVNPTSYLLGFNRNLGVSDYFILQGNRMHSYSHGGIHLTIGDETIDRILIDGNTFRSEYITIAIEGNEGVNQGNIGSLTFNNNKTYLDGNISYLFNLTNGDSLNIEKFIYSNNKLFGSNGMKSDFGAIKSIDEFIYRNNEDYMEIGRVMNFSSGFVPSETFISNNHFSVNQSAYDSTIVRGNSIYFTNNILEGFVNDTSFKLISDTVLNAGSILINSSSNAIKE